jgi:hypothetical protein
VSLSCDDAYAPRRFCLVPLGLAFGEMVHGGTIASSPTQSRDPRRRSESMQLSATVARGGGRRRFLLATAGRQVRQRHAARLLRARRAPHAGRVPLQSYPAPGPSRGGGAPSASARTRSTRLPHLPAFLNRLVM